MAAQRRRRRGHGPGPRHEQRGVDVRPGPSAPAVAGGALLLGLRAVGCAPSLPKAGGAAAGGGAAGA
ncbi:MAG: hypothetical protein ACK559_31320, partial [bacterium]